MERSLLCFGNPDAGESVSHQRAWQAWMTLKLEWHGTPRQTYPLLHLSQPPDHTWPPDHSSLESSWPMRRSRASIGPCSCTAGRPATLSPNAGGSWRPAPAVSGPCLSGTSRRPPLPYPRHHQLSPTPPSLQLSKSDMLSPAVRQPLKNTL